MKLAHAAVAATAVALLALGALAGSVVGDDGSVGVADRIADDPGEPIRQIARPLQPGAEAAGKKKKRAKKPVVFHGGGSVSPLASGQSMAVALQCPRKYPVPVSAGFNSSGTGVVANSLTRSLTVERSMLIVVANTSTEPREFQATSACMKGVKEK